MRQLAENNFEPVPVWVKRNDELSERKIQWVNIPTGWVCCTQFIDEASDHNGDMVWDEVYEQTGVEFGECPSPHGWHNPENLHPSAVLLWAKSRFGQCVDPGCLRLLTRDEIGRRSQPSAAIQSISSRGPQAGMLPGATYITDTPYGCLPELECYAFPECAPYGFSRQTGERIPCPDGYRLARVGETFKGEVDAIIHYRSAWTSPSGQLSTEYKLFVGEVKGGTDSFGHAAVFVKQWYPYAPAMAPRDALFLTQYWIIDEALSQDYMLPFRIISADVGKSLPAPLLPVPFEGPEDMEPFILPPDSGIGMAGTFMVRKKGCFSRKLTRNHAVLQNGLAWVINPDVRAACRTFRSWETLYRDYEIFHPGFNVWVGFAKSSS